MQTLNAYVARAVKRANFFSARALLAASLVVASSCSDDTTSPSFNTVTLIPSGTIVPLSGTIDITARVADLSGIPVHDGTAVTFTCCADVSAAGNGAAADGV